MPFFFPFLLARGNIFPYGGRTSISFFKLIFIGVELLDHAGLVSALQQSESLILLLFRRSVMSRLFATPWTAAHQAPLSMGILQARILAWVAVPFSRGSSRPRDRTGVSSVSCIGRWVLYHYHHLRTKVKLNMKLFLISRVRISPSSPCIFPFCCLCLGFLLQTMGLLILALVALTEWLQQTNERIDVKFFTKLKRSV